MVHSEIVDRRRILFYPTLLEYVETTSQDTESPPLLRENPSVE